MTSNTSLILATIARQLIGQLEAKAADNRLSIGLLGGDFGTICFLYQYSRIDDSYSVKADKLLDSMLEKLPLYAGVGTYCNGLSGLALGLLLLQDEGHIEGVEEALDGLDFSIMRCLDRQISNNDIDFLHGIIGYGFYFLKRAQTAREYSFQGIEKIVNHLDRVKMIDGDRVCWKLRNKEFYNIYNISLSHGMSSIAVLLSHVVMLTALGQDVRLTAEALLKGCMNYILGQSIDSIRGNLPNMFPSTWLWNKYTPAYSRLAWCYGDLGVALGMLKASRALEDPSLLDMSEKTVTNSALRYEFKDTTLYDDCVCHGVSGVALMTGYFAGIFKTPEIEKAARYWNERTIADFDAKASMCYRYFDTTSKMYKNYDNILEGIGGVGMSLIFDKHFINTILLLD